MSGYSTFTINNSSQILVFSHQNIGCPSSPIPNNELKLQRSPNRPDHYESTIPRNSIYVKGRGDLRRVDIESSNERAHATSQEAASSLARGAKKKGTGHRNASESIIRDAGVPRRGGKRETARIRKIEKKRERDGAASLSRAGSLDGNGQLGPSLKACNYSSSGPAY